MSGKIAGLHHVTAITADAQKNIDFYAGVLGLRLVKLTVNFDDPGSYHLYYGDELGRPGTVMTFFAWPGAPRGHVGPPQVTATAFAVPAGAGGSLNFWKERLRERSVDAHEGHRMAEKLLAFVDPDGMRLEIVEDASPGGMAWAHGPVAKEHAIRGFHSVTIAEEGYENTAKLLTETMGYAAAGSEENRFRYRAAGTGVGRHLDVMCVPDARRGGMGAGVVHHVAFRTADDAEQSSWRKTLVAQGLNVSPTMDRKYFHSIYYREPGGVLFEIATEGPGFTADETAEKLGTTLKLPPAVEAYRAEIEKVLPKVRVPNS